MGATAVAKAGAAPVVNEVAAEACSAALKVATLTPLAPLPLVVPPPLAPLAVAPLTPTLALLAAAMVLLLVAPTLALLALAPPIPGRVLNISNRLL